MLTKFEPKAHLRCLFFTSTLLVQLRPIRLVHAKRILLQILTKMMVLQAILYSNLRCQFRLSDRL